MGAQCDEAIVDQSRELALEVWALAKDLRQETASAFPVRVSGGHDPAGSLKGREESYGASLALWGTSSCQKLLRDDGAEVDARRMFDVEILDYSAIPPAPNEIDVQVGIDQIFAAQKIFSTPPLPATFSNDLMISLRKITRSKAASMVSVSVLVPRIFLARTIFF
ncbi:MAG TPA: hypothetical protein VGX03_21350 [Candidatus Binatia bacterium]|nr:hypothetical protein [Candidatus Binatia bacterium]